MRSKITIILAALALGGAMASTPAFAQNGKAANDGGMIAEPSGAPQYTGTGAVTTAPGNETSNCARYRSFDPASGTYVGRDGQRHSCQ